MMAVAATDGGRGTVLMPHVDAVGDEDGCDKLENNDHEYEYGEDDEDDDFGECSVPVQPWLRYCPAPLQSPV